MCWRFLQEYCTVQYFLNFATVVNWRLFVKACARRTRDEQESVCSVRRPIPDDERTVRRTSIKNYSSTVHYRIFSRSLL